MSRPPKYVELFATESRDHLTLIEHALLELERAPTSIEPVDALFRAVHTLKGMSGVMEYSAVAALAHAMETQLARVRSGEEVLTPDLVGVLFEAADALGQAIEVATAGSGAALDVSDLVTRLSTEPAHAPGSPSLDVAFPAGEGIGVRVTLDEGAPLPGARAHIILQRLAAFGRITACVPGAQGMLGAEFSGTFAVRLATEVGEDAIRDAVVRAGAVRSVVFAAAAADTPADGATSSWSEGTLGAPLQRYVRIDLRRLDALLNLVGELVISRGRLASLAEPHQDPELTEAVTQAGRLIGDVQQSVLGSRMVPVWQVFDRFPRVVRDAARSLGKEIEFRLEGREIELDRVLLEQVAEPLVHLLRNAVDHGLEPSSERVAAGKNPTGHLVLSAARERSAVVIAVQDDGRGVDKARVLAKAKQLGLADPEQATLTEEEAFKLIARPGFSTAERVSAVSGRGVGFDAVVSRVRALGGSIDMRTEPGRGTTFSLRLPVTLAIIPALLAAVEDETYALPLTHVTETTQPRRGTVGRVRGRPVFIVRDEVLPLRSLRQVVGLPDRDPEGCQIVLVQASDRRAALAVDRLLGQQEIVVKPFDAARGALSCFSGATILPDGAAALILDAGILQ